MTPIVAAGPPSSAKLFVPDFAPPQTVVQSVNLQNKMSVKAWGTAAYAKIFIGLASPSSPRIGKPSRLDSGQVSNLALPRFGRNILGSHVEMAKLFEELIATDKRFEIVVLANFALVCFRVSPLAISEGKTIPSSEFLRDDKYINDINKKLLEFINASGHSYMTPIVIDGMFVLCCVIGATLTEEPHIIMASKVVKQHADAILNMSTLVIYTGRVD
ncbi:hypothetical protein FNV43_RR06437 [Rhamnella rubrinervis]|uniref:Uncharacterized protein n=1 Tax=Rhamnella rubrinervis TaxID=2594499 RepID=A0A8K0HD21_9ROSA|nr:hypothetical protein FNV43_RR06437 [Rhamnella rubrinervis]